MLLALVATTYGQAAVSLTHFGQIRGVIVTADEPTGRAVEAAAILHRYVHAMTNVELPIMTVSEFEGQKGYQNAVLVGRSRLTEEMVNGAFFHDIFGFNEYAKVYIVEADGSRRQISMDEQFDLGEQNQFVTDLRW